MKKYLFALLILPTLCFADPAPFGLEIGKATIADAKAKYTLTDIGVNKYSEGKVFALKPSELPIEDIKAARLTFSKDGILVAVITSFSNTKYNYLKAGLQKKYTLISQNEPFVGNKSTAYEDGNTRILLDAPHMSFDMEMNYISKDLLEHFSKISSQEEKKKTEKEYSGL